MYKSKVDIVYEMLKENIISGIFKPGDRIVISQIAKQYEVSDIPVREAIRILESEDLIKIQPNVGPIVTDFKEDDILDYLTIRGVLEGYAARLSIDFMDAESLGQLDNIIELMKDALDKNDLREYGLLNTKFHCAMYEAISNVRLYKMIVELWDKWGRTRSVFILVPERANESYEEHKTILNLIKAKKYDELEFFIREHRIKIARELVNCLKSKHASEVCLDNFCQNSSMV